MIGKEMKMRLGATNIGTTDSTESRIIIFLEPAQRISGRMTSSSFKLCSPVEKKAHDYLTTSKFATWRSHLATIGQRAACGNGETDTTFPRSTHTGQWRGNGNRVVRYAKYISIYIDMQNAHINIYQYLSIHLLDLYRTALPGHKKMDAPPGEHGQAGFCWRGLMVVDHLSRYSWLITFLDIVGRSFFLMVFDHFTWWWLIKFLDIVVWSLF